MSSCVSARFDAGRFFRDVEFGVFLPAITLPMETLDKMDTVYIVHKHCVHHTLIHAHRMRKGRFRGRAHTMSRGFHLCIAP